MADSFWGQHVRDAGEAQQVCCNGQQMPATRPNADSQHTSGNRAHRVRTPERAREHIPQIGRLLHSGRRCHRRRSYSHQFAGHDTCHYISGQPPFTSCRDPAEPAAGLTGLSRWYARTDSRLSTALRDDLAATLSGRTSIGHSSRPCARADTGLSICHFCLRALSWAS